MVKNILIIGATSAIAEATARRFAQRRSRLYLLARNPERLAKLSKDLVVRGADVVGTAPLDVDRTDEHEHLIEAACEALQRVDVVLLAHGTLPDQRACEADAKETIRALSTNAIGTVSLLTHLANRLETQKGGVIAVITSVAGDRGRQSNYVYGSAKGMVSIFLQGLRNRLFRSGVRVIDIKPGFVDTPMTASFDKGLLWASPDTIARGIVRSIDHGNSTVYLPWFWRIIMSVIRVIPGPLFNKMKL